MESKIEKAKAEIAKLREKRQFWILAEEKRHGERLIEIQQDFERRLARIAARYQVSIDADKEQQNG